MVIQRLQNLYLLIAFAFMAIFCFCPFLTYLDSDVFYKVSAAGIKTVSSEAVVMNYNWATLILAIISALMPVLTIFKYKQLKQQRQLCSICAMLAVASLAIAAIPLFKVGEYSGYEVDIIPMALPLFSLMMSLLARRGVKKDLRLLSSADRIR